MFYQEQKQKQRNRNKVIFVVVVVFLIFLAVVYVFYTKPEEREKVDITKVTGGLEGGIEVLTKKGDELSGLGIIQKLRERIGEGRVPVSEAPEPQFLQKEPSFELFFKELGVKERLSKEQIDEIQKKVSENIVENFVYRERPPKPDQKYLASLHKEQEKNIALSIKATQDAIIKAGFLTEEDRSEIRTKSELESFWTKFMSSFVARSSAPATIKNAIAQGSISREEFVDFFVKQQKVYIEPEILAIMPQVIKVKKDFSGITGGSGASEDKPFEYATSRIVQSFLKQLHFAELIPNFTDRDLVDYFYAEDFLKELLEKQEKMIANGFIKEDEKVLIVNKSEVEWLKLKEIDYLLSLGKITDKEAESLKQAEESIRALQQPTLDAFLKIRESVSLSSFNTIKKAASDFAFLGIIGKKDKSFLAAQMVGIYNKFIDISSVFTNLFIPQGVLASGVSVCFGCRPSGNVMTFDLGNYGNQNLGNYVPGDECWRDIFHEMVKWDADSPLTCLLWWERPFKIPVPTTRSSAEVFIDNVFPTPVILTTQRPLPWKTVMCVLDLGRVEATDCCACVKLVETIDEYGVDIEFTTWAVDWGCYFNEIYPALGKYRPGSSYIFDLIRDNPTKLCGTDF